MPQQLADLDFNSATRIINLPNATASGHPVTFDQLNSAVEGLAWKDSVRVRAAANVNLASPGTAIDGVTMAANDRFLATNQTTTTENGIYVFNGSATPATRSLDANTFAELEAAVVTVEEGTSGGTTYRQTAVNGVIGTDTPTFVTFGTAAAAASETVAGVAEIATTAEIDTGTDNTRIVSPAGLAAHANRKRKATGTVGNASATSFAITHNFNTRDVIVNVYRNSGSYDTVIPDINRTDANTVTLVFATAPTASQFAYVIIA